MPHGRASRPAEPLGRLDAKHTLSLLREIKVMSEVRRQVTLPPRPNWGWQDAAACRGTDVVLFFGPDGERQPERDIRERKAKALCASCPVRNECLDYAISRPEKYGTWGGLSEDERASERRRRMRRANAA
jgi:WhiB family transcriptional regulator, redox-sensing transcriptional regulator